MDLGILLTDVPRAWSPRKQFEAALREVEAAQRNGFTYLLLGQHFMYGDFTLLQPVPLFARLAAEVDPHIRLVTTVIIQPLYHPVLLAEELATLDIVTEGRLIVGVGLGYRQEEYRDFQVPFKQRVSRFEEGLELMIAIWTRDEVTFDGRHWQLEGSRPHIRPWQEPHPPIWIGAFVEPAVRRAGRYADRWTIPPEVEIPDIAAFLPAFREEQEKRGLPPTHMPFRRNIFVGDDRESAMRDFTRAAGARFKHYAVLEHEIFDPEAIERDFANTIGSYAVVGTAEEVVARLTQMVHQVPVNPIMIRVGWPGMETDEVVAYLDRLGREFTPLMREVQPMRLS
jgi:alkanesulfonate monooxygenase SsuD/methylene tetrahydromethanopterin reductase-like flavin-dependent oxidoreductase (luciferase family)